MQLPCHRLLFSKSSLLWKLFLVKTAPTEVWSPLVIVVSFHKFKLVSYWNLIWNWNTDRGKEAGTNTGEQQLLQVRTAEDGVWGAGRQRLPCNAHHALQPCQDPCLLPWMSQPKCTLCTILSVSLNTKIWYAFNVLKIHIGCGCYCCIPCHTIASGKGTHMHICCTYSRGSRQGIGGTFYFILFFFPFWGMDWLSHWWGCLGIFQFFLLDPRLFNSALIF